ncbi:hypothetical protein Q8A73_008424 [Channa argus]|nr:hypothetical protein Q8A73_008424 [Channa argus]
MDDGEVYRLLKTRNAAFRAGDEVGLRTARANLSRGIREAKRQYSRRIAHQFSNSRDTPSLWQGIQTITDYRPPLRTCDSNISLLNEVNAFFARFEKPNCSTAQKTPPPPCDQVLMLTPDSVRRSFSTESSGSEVRRLAGWCSDNNLSLNVEKTKEIVVDFRRALTQHAPLTINGAYVERVRSTKFLGVHITEDLSWTDNTAALAKKSQQRLYFLRKLRGARAPPPIMYTFYRGTIESILTSCITVWYGPCNASCRKTLQRIVRAAEKIIGVSLPSLQDIYGTCLTCKALCIAGDPTHPSHSFFSLLPSGRRLQSLQARTSRLKDSFIHQAVRKLNLLPNLPPIPSSASVLYCTGAEL